MEEDHGIKSWATYENLIGEDKLTLYINSLYWSTITILTVGYGDIVPYTIYEKLFVMIMSLLTCGVFGYSINSIG